MTAQHLKPLVLICSNNANFYVLLAHILAREGFQAALVSEDEAVDRATARQVTAIILDSAEDSGVTLRRCAAIKAADATSRIPTIALVSTGDERYYLALLKAGVDENFVRPSLARAAVGYRGAMRLSPHHDRGDRPEGRLLGQLFRLRRWRRW